ncbi:hypothetical protein [Noviherbaspirillum aerium]|uniref:hypothetical protein n=1 Tax=Noviherbaspirillum aerium TaxID=2588497 RepID=UPI00124D3FB3|nr:hypothetical protein [Noviherbaspirillum aerium]
MEKQQGAAFPDEIRTGNLLSLTRNDITTECLVFSSPGMVKFMEPDVPSAPVYAGAIPQPDIPVNFIELKDERPHGT